MRVSRVLYLAIASAVWAALAIYAARITHDFFVHADRAVYASVDDGEANIAYELATQGRYAFPASPLLEGMSRMHGQFNYGPWYFYIAAGFIWVFGYSLTLVRSIHLWVILLSIALAISWFRGRGGVAAAALFGFSLLFFFEVAEWPMARPDSLVTLCAVIMTVAAGRGLSRGRPLAWFVAGLAAACGAFTHLIAASLLGSVVLLFVVFAWRERRADPLGYMSRVRTGAIALVAGVLVGVLMFYASFGFDVAEQWRFLTGYRALTKNSDTFATAVSQHFRMAFAFVPVAIQRTVWLTLGIAWLMIVFSLRSDGERAKRVVTYVLPPAVIWTLYFLTNGKYTNYHTGYAILHHAMFVWTASAIVFVVCGGSGRASSPAGVLPMFVMLLVFGQGVRQIRWERAAPVREVQAVHRVDFHEYVERVLAPVPRGSVAWGSVFFGIDAPDRVQLVQQDDAITLVSALDPAARSALAPEFLLWGYPEVRGDITSGLARADTRLRAMRRLLPSANFQLVALVDAAPYGVTRVYARDRGGNPIMPTAAAYDEVHRQWVDRLGAPLPVTFQEVAPATLRIGYEAEPAPSTASQTLSADVPPGRYLVTVGVRTGSRDGSRMIAVTASTMARQTLEDLGPRPEGDFAEYLEGASRVFALIAHPGGPMFVSRFDAATGDAIESVSVAPLVDLSDPVVVAARTSALPPLTRWIEMPGIQGEIRGGTLSVDGDASPGSYQLFSPLVAVAPGDHVEADVPSVVLRGRVCAGVLNARGQWIVTASSWREQMDFVADATGGFRVAYTNCQRGEETASSQFEVKSGTYRVAGRPAYSDRLVRAGLGEPEPAPAWTPPPAPRYPEQPVVLVKASDIEQHADGVTHDEHGWSIASSAASSPFLLRARTRYIDNETRLLVGGRLDRGTLVVGLLKDGAWVARRDVSQPGDFIVALAPKETGRYAVAIAAGAGGPAVTATLTRVDLLPPVRPAK